MKLQVPLSKAFSKNFSDTVRSSITIWDRSFLEQLFANKSLQIGSIDNNKNASFCLCHQV